VQAALSTFLVQIDPLQTNPLAQSALVAHFVMQPAPPHVYGLQFWRLDAPQMPDPSHFPPSVAVPAAQEFAPQIVPGT